MFNYYEGNECKVCIKDEIFFRLVVNVDLTLDWNFSPNFPCKPSNWLCFLNLSHSSVEKDSKLLRSFKKCYFVNKSLPVMYNRIFLTKPESRLNNCQCTIYLRTNCLYYCLKVRQTSRCSKINIFCVQFYRGFYNEQINTKYNEVTVPC